MSKSVSEVTPEVSGNVTENPKDVNEESKKRSADQALEENPKKQFRQSDGDFVMKMMCPFWCVGAIIGTKGDDIKRMKDESGCSIKVTKNFENFPSTNERVVSFRGDPDQIKKLIVQVQNIIREDKPPANGPQRDNSKRKGCLKLVVATSSAGRIIGKGGCRSKQFQDDFDVHINVMKASEIPPGLNESAVTITGENSKVDQCMEEIVDLILDDAKFSLSWNVDYRFHGEQGGYQNNDQGRGGYGSGGYQQRGGYGGGGGYQMPYNQGGYYNQGQGGYNNYGYNSYGGGGGGYGGGRW